MRDNKKMKSVLSEYAMCNHCTDEVQIKELLDRVHDAWPVKSWIIYRCSNCGESNHLSLGNGFVKTGYLDGAPGPCFIPKDHITLDDFKLKTSQNKIVVKTLNLRWDFAKK